MAKKTCLICGKEMGMMTGKVQCADGWICTKCFMETGMAKFTTDTNALMAAKGMSLADIVGAGETRQDALSIIASFTPTYEAAPYAKFNDDTKQMILSAKPHISYKPEQFTLFSYDQLIDFELLEDGTSVAKGGLGRAVAGGVLFGGVGAVVGGVTGKRKSNQICKKLKVKLTVKDYMEPAFYISLISFPAEIKKNSLTYNSYMKDAQAILSKLQLITDEMSSNVAAQAAAPQVEDVTEQIRKFKALLDDGIISQEEFDTKKKELLGL